MTNPEVGPGHTLGTKDIDNDDDKETPVDSSDNAANQLTPASQLTPACLKCDEYVLQL